MAGTLACVSLASALSGCAPPAANGMVEHAPQPSPDNPLFAELARVKPAPDQRALLVVHRKTACSGSARVVLMDANGTFIGAVGPGEASLLPLPARTRTLLAVSSVEITARPGTWFALDEVTVPDAPGGLLLESTRVNARQCGKGNYADVEVATKPVLEAALAEADVRWMDPRPEEGQAWLAANRERVDELLERKKAPAPAVVSRTRVP